MPTPNLSQLNRIVLLMVVSLPLCAHAENDREEFRLFPGESYTSFGVALTWEVLDATDEATEPKNLLHFKGPKSEIRDVIVSPQQGDGIAYLDDVLIDYRPESINVDPPRPYDARGGAPGPRTQRIRSMVCTALVRSSSVNVLHRMEDPALYVSEVNPAQVNHLRFTVSPGKVSYPDGSEYLEIVATDKVSGATQTIPAANDAVKSIDRLSVAVSRVNEAAKTVALKIAVQPDLTIRGKDAWLEEYKVNQGANLESSLVDLAEEYEFEIDRQPYEGMAESIDYAKNLYLEHWHLGVPYTLEEVLETLKENMLKDTVTFEWKTPTLLSVYPAGYKKVHEFKEHAEARKEEIRRIDEMNDKALTEFKEKYQTMVRVFTLKSLTPITAKALIDQELHSYSFGYGNSQREPQVSSHEVDFFEEQGVKPGARPGEDPSSLLVTEQCIADEKANAVIVTALPETHDRISALLSQMEAVFEIEQTEKAMPLQLYKIDVALLQSAEPEIVDATPKYWDKLDTELEAISIDGDQLSSVIDLLATHGETNINLSQTVRGGEINLNLSEPGTIRDTLNTLAKMYDLWIDYQPETVLIRPAKEKPPSKIVDPGEYGLNPEDLDKFHVEAVAELGRSIQSITNSKESGGSFAVGMGDGFLCELSYQDHRDPYLIAKGELKRGSVPLIDSTLFLEQDKPSVLAITNMKDTLILVVRLLEVQ